ncbi:MULTISPECIES: serine hydrolase [unclassified Empedobacter]|uniref:serine hydrolase domain-containing protein n=1 Tax=Empedobacter TaxID=59734 RepID=UPI0025B9DAA9|nr:MULTISPECIES: serine hydrolase domain-containing protein [unclassified Empedobacter]
MKKVLLALTCIATTSTFAQQINKPALDSLFLSLHEQKIGAGSVSIFENGKEIYSNSYGNRDYESNLVNNNDTKFRIGSITKTFTATLIMKMIENGKLTLETKLSKFYPKVKNADKITIQNLLQHQSGINNITSNKEFLEWYLQDLTKEQLLEKIYPLKSDFEPNTKEGYSNTNYILLGFILEDVSKKSFQDLIENIIIKPLKLKNTKVGGKILINQNEAKSYNYFNNTYHLLPESSMTIPLGAGIMVSTPTDLNTFIYSLLNGKIVSEKSVKQMTTINDEFGFGLFYDKINDTKGIGHNGSIDGFSSYTFCFDHTAFCYAITQNANEISKELLKTNLYNATHNKKIEFPKKVISIDVSSEILEKYSHEYSSNELPIAIKFFVEDGTFMAQGTGQSAFPLTAISTTEFEFAPAKIRINFNENGSEMKLIQNGKTFNFNKK